MSSNEDRNDAAMAALTVGGESSPGTRSSGHAHPSSGRRPRALGLRVALGAVRAWTRLYTWRLPPALRDARRAEIESDLWECQHDEVRDEERPQHADGSPPPRSCAAARGSSTSPSGARLPLAAQVVARLLVGIPDDLSWRAEQAAAAAAAGRRPLGRTVALTAIAGILLLASLWALPALLTGALPTPPAAPRFTRRAVPAPTPPPPPPPPCPPPALGGCAR